MRRRTEEGHKESKNVDRKITKKQKINSDKSMKQSAVPNSTP